MQDVRSKARTLPVKAYKPEDLPHWNYGENKKHLFPIKGFIYKRRRRTKHERKRKTLTKTQNPAPQKTKNTPDGSSTGQAPGNDSEVYLIPRAIFRDPFRGGANILVLCDTYEPPKALPDGTMAPPVPIPTNTRYACAEAMDKAAGEEGGRGVCCCAVSCCVCLGLLCGRGAGRGEENPDATTARRKPTARETTARQKTNTQKPTPKNQHPKTNTQKTNTQKPTPKKPTPQKPTPKKPTPKNPTPKNPTPKNPKKQARSRGSASSRSTRCSTR